MHSTLSVPLYGLALLASSVRALEVVAGSPCYDTCDGSNGGTPSTALVCSDTDYTTTQYGKTMAGCLTCESTSLATNNSAVYKGGNSDEYWFLFNMKYTLQTCVIDASTKTAPVQACSDQCQPLQPVLDTLWLATNPYANQYDYCSILSGTFPAKAPGCAACLQSMEGSVILGNFMQIMSNACASEPLAQNNQLVSLPRSLLDTSTIASTTSATSSAATSTRTSSAAATSHLSSSSTTTASSASQTSTPSASAAATTKGLSNGAAAGIGIAVGLVAAAVIGALTFWVLRRRKQQRRGAEGAEFNVPHQKQGNGIYSPELPGYSYAPTALNKEDKDASQGKGVAEIGGSDPRIELHGSDGYSAAGHGSAVELDAGRELHQVERPCEGSLGIST